MSQDLNATLLAQMLSHRDEEVRDYAMNEYAEETAFLNIMLQSIKDPKAREGLEQFKREIRSMGKAKWIKRRCSELTHIALELPKEGRFRIGRG